MFDLAALHAALDARRRERGLTLAALARQTGVAAATIARLAGARVMEADGVLTLVAWLGAPPEAFCSPVRSGAPLRPGLNRLSAPALHAALDARRRTLGLTWSATAAGMAPAPAPAALTRLARGGRADIQTLAAAAAWLGRPMADFVRR